VIDKADARSTGELVDVEIVGSAVDNIAELGAELGDDLEDDVTAVAGTHGASERSEFRLGVAKAALDILADDRECATDMGGENLPIKSC
jgi:hypothetical protein